MTLDFFTGFATVGVDASVSQNTLCLDILSASVNLLSLVISLLKNSSELHQIRREEGKNRSLFVSFLPHTSCWCQMLISQKKSKPFSVLEQCASPSPLIPTSKWKSKWNLKRFRTSRLSLIKRESILSSNRYYTKF